MEGVIVGARGCLLGKRVVIYHRSNAERIAEPRFVNSTSRVVIELYLRPDESGAEFDGTRVVVEGWRRGGGQRKSDPG